MPEGIMHGSLLFEPDSFYQIVVIFIGITIETTEEANNKRDAVVGYRRKDVAGSNPAAQI